MQAAPGRRLLSQLSAERWRWAGVAALLVASVLGEVAVPYFCGRVTDWVVAEDELAAAWALVLLGLASAGTEFCCDVCFGGTLGRALGRLQRRAFAALLQHHGTAPKPGTAPGPPPPALTGDLEAAHQALAEALISLLWYLVRGIGLLGTMAWLCPPLALGTFLPLLALLLLPRVVGKVQQRLARQVQDALTDATKVAVETFQAMGTIKSFAHEPGATRRYQGHLGHICQLEAKEAATYAANFWASGLVAVVLKLGLLCYGEHLVASGDISPGDLLSGLICQMQFTEAVEVVLQHFPNLAKAVGASEKVLELLAQEEQGTVAAQGTLAPEVLQGHLQLQDVWFSYPGQQEAVLRGVSLELRPGEVVAVVAPRGAGKSTLAALALGLRAPTAGRVLLDGHPVAAYQHRYLRRQVSLVPQDPQLFCRSLLSNLHYGCGRCSLPQLTAACRCAGADRFIASLPRGYHTEVGELGGQLSGGQRQLVALARALLRDPKVLVLDEPSSALDAGSRLQVEQEIFGGAGAGRAVLLLTAQLALASRAQRVAVLEGGQLHPLAGSPGTSCPLPAATGICCGGGDKGRRRRRQGTGRRGWGGGRRVGGEGSGSRGESTDRDGDSKDWDGDPKDRTEDIRGRAGDTKSWDRDPKDTAGAIRSRDEDIGSRAGDTKSWDGDPKDRAGAIRSRAGATRSRAETTGRCSEGP